MSDIKKLQARIVGFRDERDWKQFHNPKDTAISIICEAAELLDEFKWKTPQQIEEHVRTNKQAVADELMDVLYSTLLLCHDLDIDIPAEFERKMRINEQKYPVEKAKGKNLKYTKLT